MERDDASVIATRMKITQTIARKIWVETALYMNKHHKKMLKKARENTIKVTETDRDRGLACNLEMLQRFQEVQENAGGNMKKQLKFRESVQQCQENKTENQKDRG